MREELPGAKNVFLFRLESLSRVQNALANGDVSGTISIIRTFRGKPSFRTIRFSTERCGGNRLDVGNRFVIATSQAGEVLSLRSGDETVLDVTNVVDPPALYASLAKGSLPKGFPSYDQSNYTLTFPHPPPRK
jgi:hypothetical protein